MRSLIKKMEVSKTKRKKSKNRFLSNISKHKYAYALIAPSLIFVFIFAYLPLAGVIIAFKNFDIIKGIIGSPWVGFENFKTIFTYPDMIKAIGNTLLYGAVILFGAFPFPIILAVLFNELRNMKFKKVTQTISYMPYFLSWISVIGLFYSIFALEGTFNSVMAKIIGESYEAKNILLDSKYFLPIIYFSHLWKNVGWSSVLYLAAIAGIDPTLYEAASIDGCGRLRQVWNITIPCIRTTILVVLIMSLGTLVNTNFQQVYGFQNVYTQESTEVINTFIYRQGIENGKYSLATAFGLTQGVVTIILLLTANSLSKKFCDTSIW